MEKLCVVRIISILKKSGSAQSIMGSLNLKKLYSCTLLDKTKSNLGMLKKIDNLVTYGEIDAETLKALLARRAMVSSKKRYEWQGSSLDDFTKAFLDGKQSFDDIKIKSVFNLHPPIKGFERRGKKTPFNLKGAFGYRGAEINKLLKRMI